VSSAQKNDPQTNRPDRFVSHSLIEIRRFKILPFSIQSAVLLDISLGGFKAEFTAENYTKMGEIFWLSIPLSPLGIYAPNRLLLHSQCRWFDSTKFRLGGVFIELKKSDRIILEQVIETIQEQGAKVI
jgi:hypothetical protein